MGHIPITNGARIALALWLSAPWAGALETLEAFEEIFKECELDAYKPAGDAQGNTGVTIEKTTRLDAVGCSANLSQGALEVIMRAFPGHATPAALGLYKVAFLRACRDALKKEPDAQG